MKEDGGTPGLDSLAAEYLMLSVPSESRAFCKAFNVLFMADDTCNPIRNAYKCKINIRPYYLTTLYPQL